MSVNRYFEIIKHTISVDKDTITFIVNEVDSGVYLDLKFGLTYKYKDYEKWDAEDLHKEMEKDIDKYIKKLDKVKQDKDDDDQAELDHTWVLGQTILYEDKDK